MEEMGSLARPATTRAGRLARRLALRVQHSMLEASRTLLLYSRKLGREYVALGGVPITVTLMRNHVGHADIQVRRAYLPRRCTLFGELRFGRSTAAPRSLRSSSLHTSAERRRSTVVVGPANGTHAPCCCTPNSGREPVACTAVVCLGTPG